MIPKSGRPNAHTDAQPPSSPMAKPIASYSTFRERSKLMHLDSGYTFESSSNESDETASDCFSVTESRSEVSYDDVSSTISSSASSSFEYDYLIKFHCKEFQAESEDNLSPLAVLDKSRVSPIVSRRGSTRGVRGQVRAAIATFKESAEVTHAKNYQLLERGKAVLYVTSLAVCRGPFLRCLEIRKIFHNLMIKFVECDLYMNRDYQHDLKERLGSDKADSVPHLFIEGHYVGDFDVLQNLNESGQLRAMLKPYKAEICEDVRKLVKLRLPVAAGLYGSDDNTEYSDGIREASEHRLWARKRYGVAPPCQRCGGFSVIPCSICFGSKKSNHRNTFTDQFHALRCSACDANGLQQCPLCSSKS